MQFYTRREVAKCCLCTVVFVAVAIVLPLYGLHSIVGAKNATNAEMAEVAVSLREAGIAVNSTCEIVTKNGSEVETSCKGWSVANPEEAKRNSASNVVEMVQKMEELRAKMNSLRWMAVPVLLVPLVCVWILLKFVCLAGKRRRTGSEFAMMGILTDCASCA